MIDIYKYIVDHGIEVVREDGLELACYCPFHANSDSPAFYINKKTGLWICFNPGCNKKGSMRDLMVFFGDHRGFVRDYSLDDIEENLSHVDVVVDEGWDDTLDKIRIRFPEEREKATYLLNRGFLPETIKYFEVGYSEVKKRVVIPVRDQNFKMIGFIGRAVNDDVEPRYLYSKGFPRKDILFNLQNAKRYPSVVVTEGSLDALKIHQSGFPNVVSTLGAAITQEHFQLLRGYFNKIYIFSDNDKAGMEMRNHVIQHCADMELMIVEYPSIDYKDPGSMSEGQINESIKNAVDYLAWAYDL